MPNQEFTNINGVYVCDETARNNIPDVINNLDSTDSAAALSAAQGKALSDRITNLTVSGGAVEVIDNLQSTSTTAALSANKGRQLNAMKVSVYPTVDAMVAASDIEAGMLVRTLGYYAIGDGGAAEYIVRAKTDADTSDDVFIQINGNLVCEILLKDGAINLAQLGFFATRASDGATLAVEVRTDIFKKAILKMNGGGKIIIPAGEFGLDPMYIDEYISKVTIMGVSTGSSGLNVRSNTANKDKYLFNFNRGMREMRFEGFQISGADNCNGFFVDAYNKSDWGQKRNVYIDFKDVYIWRVKKGISIENGVYVQMDDVKVHLTGGAVSGEDFGIKLIGYEYNYFRDCSIQTNKSGTYPDCDLMIIQGAEHCWIDACEFAKTNGACIKFTTKDINIRVGYMKVTHCKFQKAGRGVVFELGDSKGIGDIILDDIDYIAAHSNNNGGNLHPAISAYRVNPKNDGVTTERDVYKLHVRNFFFGTEGSYATGEIIKFDEYPQSATPILMREVGLENVISGIGNTNNNLICIPDGAKVMYLRVTDSIGRQTTMTQRSAANKSFTITTKQQIAITSNIIPHIGLTFRGLEGYHFKQSNPVRNSNGSYSVYVVFEEAPPMADGAETTYDVYYSLTYA